MLSFILMGLALAVVLIAIALDTFDVSQTANIEALPDRIVLAIDSVRGGEKVSPSYRPTTAYSGWRPDATVPARPALPTRQLHADEARE